MPCADQIFFQRGTEPRQKKYSPFIRLSKNNEEKKKKKIKKNNIKLKTTQITIRRY